jgi:lipopolysaccharide export LptBFGC system permease protein LptF
VVRYALLPVFLVFEVLFYGLLEVFSERTNELFPFWAVVTANTLAALCMGLYLWLRHPDFRSAVRDTPLGDAPR